MMLCNPARPGYLQREQSLGSGEENRIRWSNSGTAVLRVRTHLRKSPHSPGGVLGRTFMEAIKQLKEMQEMKGSFRYTDT